MSDSDDTDILLLIPPDFFLTQANASLNYDSFQTQLKDKSATNASDPLIFRQLEQNSVKRPMDSSKLYFTPSKSSSDHQNFVYRKSDRPSPQIGTSYSSPYENSKLYKNSFPSSTPYLAQRSHLSEYSSPPKKSDVLTLDRVDRFLGKCSIGDNKRATDIEVRMQQHSMAERRSDAGGTAHDTCATKTPIETTPTQNIQRYASKPTEDDILNSLVSNKMSDWNSGLQKSLAKNDEPLISLASVWDGDDRGKCDAITTAHAMQEQELRIRQYERTIQNLQTQLKQYQDKCSDAIKMDQTKNEALARLHETNSSLIANNSQLESQLSTIELKFHRQHNDLKAKIRHLQEENEQLERKANGFLLTTNEVRDIHRKQLNDAETRLANSKHAENQLSEELSNLKTKFVQLQNENDDEKRHVSVMQMKLSTLQKSFDEKEESLRKEINDQRTSLKQFYQSQLDEKVNEKLREFQKQLDHTEETIRKEFKQSERTIAERAIKQIELISQKNEQEFALLQEKHEKEIELYHIQLGNATKLIGQLEQSLSAYKVKRSDIAERLHDVVETQWQKTLEILSNNEPPKTSIDIKTKQLLDELSRMGSSVIENETATSRQILSKKENSAKFDLPTASKIKRTNIVDLG